MSALYITFENLTQLNGILFKVEFIVEMYFFDKFNFIFIRHACYSNDILQDILHHGLGSINRLYSYNILTNTYVYNEKLIDIRAMSRMLQYHCSVVASASASPDL